MAAYAGGDDQVFPILYDSLAPRLEGYLRGRGRDQAQVDDLVQATFLKMHIARGHFIPGAEVVPWAFAIARGLMTDSSRKTYREECRDLSDEQDALAGSLPSSSPTGEQVVQAKETAARLSKAYETVSQEQRDAVELVKDKGLSTFQAASILGITAMAVRLRIHRYYRAMRGALGDGDDFSEPPPAAKEL
jgi:RNA polymerase sigma-70 factor (ECF subfamily)